LYKDPIAVDKTTTIVAVSFKDGFAPSNATTGTYLVGADARPALSTFHIGNSLTGTTGRFATYAQTAGKNHTYTSYLQPGILTWALWETDVMTTKERWEKTLASVTRAEHFTLQPRDPDIAHEAKYDVLFFDVIRSRFPDVQPWIYAEWTNRARNRPWDRGTVPTTQMSSIQPALTWEESASNMLVYIEDLRDKVAQTYKSGKRPRILPSVLATGWIKNLLDHGKVPGLGPKDFDPIMFFDGVHPGPDGAYMIDLTWYAAFYRDSPEGKTLPVNTQLSAAQAKVIERLAWDVVKNYPDCGLYEAGTDPVGTPEFSLAPTKLDTITRVTLSSSTAGAWFRYTLDGTTPTRTRGYVYCGVISVMPGTTVKAVAYKSGMADSSVAQAAYPSARAQTATPKLPDNVVLERNVQYGQAGTDPLLLDILRPKEDSERLRPAILHIHGGGWNAGDKDTSLSRLLPLAASGEYVCASANYRFASQALWPAQIHDCKAAVRWLKANAGILKIDPKRIGVIGESAGGHLVSMLGLTGDNAELEGTSGSPGLSSKVACVVDICGPSDLVTFNSWLRPKGEPVDAILSRLLGGPVDQHPDVARQASPINYVSSAAPPMLILHGTKDQTVPSTQSEDLYAALQKAGANATLVKVVGAPHSIVKEPQLWERARIFFAKYLRGEKVEISAAPIEPAQ
jgi:acetyl esterase/lipase